MARCVLTTRVLITIMLITAMFAIVMFVGIPVVTVIGPSRTMAISWFYPKAPRQR